MFWEKVESTHSTLDIKDANVLLSYSDFSVFFAAFLTVSLPLFPTLSGSREEATTNHYCYGVNLPLLLGKNGHLAKNFASFDRHFHWDLKESKKFWKF